MVSGHMPAALTVMHMSYNVQNFYKPRVLANEHQWRKGKNIKFIWLHFLPPHKDVKYLKKLQVNVPE